MSKYGVFSSLYFPKKTPNTEISTQRVYYGEWEKKVLSRTIENQQDRFEKKITNKIDSKENNKVEAQANNG